MVPDACGLSLEVACGPSGDAPGPVCLAVGYRRAKTTPFSRRGAAVRTWKGNHSMSMGLQVCFSLHFSSSSLLPAAIQITGFILDLHARPVQIDS